MDEQFTIRIVRGKLGNEFWGFNLELNGEHIHHVGTLVEAESYAEGYAAGLHRALDVDVEIRIGPEGLSTRKALLEPSDAPIFGEDDDDRAYEASLDA